MSEDYGTRVILSESIEPKDPLPWLVKELFRRYGEILKEVYCGKKEMDSEDAHEERCSS